MGIIIAVNTIASLFFALVFFPSLLTLFDNSVKAAKKGMRRMNSSGENEGMEALATESPTKNKNKSKSKSKSRGEFASADPEEGLGDDFGNEGRQSADSEAFEMVNLHPNENFTQIEGGKSDSLDK